MSTMVILFIGHLWPEPSSSAAGYRTLALLKAMRNLRPNWQLHFASAAEQNDYCADLEALSVYSHSIILNDSSFDEFIAQLQPDLVIYDRFISEEQFAPRVHEHCPDAVNILDTQDLHFLRRARQNALKKHQEVNLFTEDSIREISAILRSDLSLIISIHEMQLLVHEFHIPDALLYYCPFMLTVDPQQASTYPPFEQREHFVMIGNFLHPPNWDAVLWCYQKVWPLIRQQMPQAQLHVYGAYDSEKVWQLHQPDKGFIIKGRADQVHDTLSQYRVNLAPLRFGAGIKGKIADGFIAQTPCVTTPIGQEGMAEQLPWGGLVTDDCNDAEQIAQYAVDLYNKPTLWKQCSRQGLQIVRQQFNEAEHANAFINRLQSLLDNVASHRKDNFMGRILRHHLYRSQYFMSKWIEEKNKSK